MVKAVALFPTRNSSNYLYVYYAIQGRNERGKEVSNSPGAESLRGTPKIPISTTSAFFNPLHMFPKDLRFEHRGAKVASCPGRHLTPLRLCCTGSIPETGFRLCKLPKSCVSYRFSIAFLLSLLLFLSKLPSSVIYELVKNIYLHSSGTSPEAC